VDNIPFAADPVDASVNTSEVQCQFVDLGPDTGFCDSTTLDATMPDASYTWSDGSHGPTLTVEAAGTYWVAVESPCCSSSDTVDLSAVAPPTAVFGISTSSCDLTISTTNSSLNTDDFSWDFGDGTTSTESQPVHSYNAAGTYVITLTAIGTCSESMDSLTVEVVPPMDVQILGPDTLCTIAQGNYSTTAADSLIVSWLWSTGEPTPECTFGTANSTYLAVTLTTTAGCTMTDSMAIQVTPAPEAGFTFPTASCDTLIMFLDASLHASTWSWNLGNGESSVVPSPSSHYAGSGSYTVTQVVTNACGSDTSVQTLDQGPTGVLTLNGPQSSCQGESATYTIDLQGPDISIAQWIPGIDGLTTINAVMAMDTVIHVYVTGDDGCAYADSISVVVLPLPSASFTATEASCDSTVRFTDNSLHATTWTWDLGNGAWLDEDSLIASYLPGTTSAVSLIVSNFCGSDTMVQMIQLDPFQDLQVNGPARICNDDPISLTLGGMDTDLDEIQWSTGDTAQAITLVPTNGQVITVNALNSHGCALFASYQVVFAGDDGVAPAYIPNVFTPNEMATMRASYR
jgi:PKD repeat protein